MWLHLYPLLSKLQALSCLLYQWNLYLLTSCLWMRCYGLTQNAKILVSETPHFFPLVARYRSHQPSKSRRQKSSVKASLTVAGSNTMRVLSNATPKNSGPTTTTTNNTSDNAFCADERIVKCYFRLILSSLMMMRM